MLSNDLLARHMDRFFLPWQLSSLTSLDLVWTLQHSHQPLASGKAKQSYNELWESLAFAPLPSLRRLRVHIDPTHDNRYPGFDVSTFTEAWLGPVFAYASRSTIDHFEFGIPDTYLRHFDEHSISQRTFVLRRLKSQNLRRLERGLERGSMCCCDADTARDRLRQCHFIHQAFPPGEPIHPVHCKGCLPEDQPVPRDRDQVDCRLMD